MALIGQKETIIWCSAVALTLTGACGGKSQREGDGEGTGGGAIGDGDGDGDSSSNGGTGGRIDGVGGTAPGGAPSTGGSTPLGGAPSTGGDNSAGGGGTGGEGTGGDGGTVTTATLGDPCASPGSFACAESNPKLALLCNSSGEWEARETCPGEALCDSNAGLALGTCRVPLAECEGHDEPLCEEGERLVECLPGGFETRLIEECGIGYACQGSGCIEVPDGCPMTAGPSYNCSDDDCSASNAGGCNSSGSCENQGAGVFLDNNGPALVRLPTQGMCSAFPCNRKNFLIVISELVLPQKDLRVTVGPGWGLIGSADENIDQCADVSEQCVVVPALKDGETWRGVALVPLTETPLVRNVAIEAVDPGTTCD